MKKTSKVPPSASRHSSKHQPIQQKKQPTKKQIPTTKSRHLTNQDYLKRTLILLGLDEPDYLKQNKLKFNEDAIFPKNQVNPSSSKPFFYIAYICMKNIVREEELGQLSMWYPPRNVNEQLEFKKVLWKMLQNLQNASRIPKNILLSKNSIMGQAKASQLLQFLRFLSELALRQQYIQQYSHKQKLIQITHPGYSYPTNSSQNDINRFYCYPFVPSQSTSDSQLPQNIQQSTKQTIKIFQFHIRNYTAKISKLSLNTKLTELQLPHQQILCKLTEQKQINETLLEKVPKKILSENRAFDRRRVLGENEDIWTVLNNHEWIDLQIKDSSIIDMQGEIDEILSRWSPVKGMTNIVEANSLLDKKLAELKKTMENNQRNFKDLQQKITSLLSK